MGVRSEEKLKSTREELLEECKDKVNYARDEKKNMEEKLDRIKKTYKANETMYIKKISEFEKENEFIKDKHQTTESKHNEL
jgi:CMP-N-acetylneuraminic acid synthetase